MEQAAGLPQAVIDTGTLSIGIGRIDRQRDIEAGKCRPDVIGFMPQNDCDPRAVKRGQQSRRAAHQRLITHWQQQLVGLAHAPRLTGRKKDDGDISHR